MLQSSVPKSSPLPMPAQSDVRGPLPGQLGFFNISPKQVHVMSMEDDDFSTEAEPVSQSSLLPKLREIILY